MSASSQIAQVIKNTNQKPKDIIELEFKDIPIVNFTAEIKSQLEKCTKLEVLTLSGCGLQSLENLPFFPQLKFLDLENNKLTDASLTLITQYKTLTQLLLERNKIQKIESIDTLGALKDLEALNLLDNPIAAYTNYRTKAFDTFPQLVFLDDLDKEGNPAEEEAEDEEEEESQEYEEEDDEDESAYEESDYSEEEPKPKRGRGGRGGRK